MRVRIVITPDVGGEHGMRRGRTFRVDRVREKKGRLARGYWVTSDTGKPVLLLEHEVVVMPDGWE